MEFKAAIFDLDGTVVADEDEYGEAFNRVLSQFGIDTGSSYPHVAGIGMEENWDKFKNKYKSKIRKTIEELSAETQREYEKLLNRVKPKKGFIDFIEKIRGDGKITALATSNSWPATDKILTTLALSDYFDFITTAEEVDYKKPDPQIFKISLSKMGIAKENCIVFEDSQAGVNAAKSLGMKAVAFYRNDEHRKTLKKADLIIKDYTQFTLKLIKHNKQ